jgi:glycosyltransferase involved in cell wall biosynthesis
MRILFLSHLNPLAPGGLGIRLRGLLGSLSSDQHVVVVALDHPPEEEWGRVDMDLGRAVERLLCVRLPRIVVPNAAVGPPMDSPLHPRAAGHWERAVRAAWTLLEAKAPLSTYWLRRIRLLARPIEPPEQFCHLVRPALSGYQAVVEEALVNHGPFDVVETDNFLAPWLPMQIWHLPRIVTFPDVLYPVVRREGEISGDPLRHYQIRAYRVARFERLLARAYDVVITVGEADRDAVARLTPEAEVRVVENAIDLSLYVPTSAVPDPDVIMFVGNMDFGPNIDAVVYFVREILPLIVEAAPRARFEIVGVNPTMAVQELASDAVRVIGRVANVREHLARAQVVVLPLRLGGSGAKLKLLESLALAKPVVATPLGCSGVPVESGRHLLVGRSAREFAEAVLQLLANEALRKELARDGRRLIEGHYAVGKAAQRLEEVYSRAVERALTGDRSSRQRAMQRLHRDAQA